MEHENDILITERPTKENDLFVPESKPAPITPTIKKQRDLFENYETKKYEQVYDKYEVLQSYNPKKQDRNLKDFQKIVDDNNSYEPTKETISVERVKPKFEFKLKKRAKIFLVAFCCVLVMLGGLMIYNAVEISNLQTNITDTTEQINDTNVQIDKIIKDIGNLTNEQQLQEEADNSNFSNVEPQDEVTVELLPKNEVPVYQSKTNFFDSICNFFRSIFGG